MSLRNMRKLLGPTTLPPPESSDEEYEPLYVTKSNKKNYDILVLSSSSESANESAHESTHESEDIPSKPVDIKKNKKRNNKKGNKVKPKPTEPLENVDEVEKSLREVNALLGEPTSSKGSSDGKPKQLPFHDHFSVQFKHLNVNNELNRLFGPDSGDEEAPARRRGRKPNLRIIQRGSIIGQEFIFHAKGLSMSIVHRDDDYTYFTFDHSKEYQRRHKTYLASLKERVQVVEDVLGDPVNSMHVEHLLEDIDYFFGADDYTNGNRLTERVISYFHHVALPTFNLTNKRTRLEYKYLENRPFHLIILKYVYLQTNKACHRTALELAKLLLCLDPSDPLAVIFILDVLALRAREHEWLLDTLDYLMEDRKAKYLFNVSYSYALAKFHVLKQKKADLAEADQLLEEAMLKHPVMVLEILKSAKQSISEQLQKSTLFNAFANETTAKSQQELIKVYVTFVCPKWREPPVMEWLLRNANNLAQKYETCDITKAQAKSFSEIRLSLFVGWPEQVLRHFSVIEPLSNLLVDGVVPRITVGRCFDPFPATECVDRYEYNKIVNPNMTYSNSVLELITSVLPQFQMWQNH